MSYLKVIALFMFINVAIIETLTADVTLVVSDPDGSAGRVNAPISVKIDLKKMFGNNVNAAQLRLVELKVSKPIPNPIPVQFVPDRTSSSNKEEANRPASTGTLWWLMPRGEKGDRRFRLTAADTTNSALMAIQVEGEGNFYDIFDGESPVLRYNFGSVPVPKGTRPHFAKGESYERGDYISPLYGPTGEILTDDYPRDHPHHRGVWWSWPVTRWHDKVFDIWAVVGVHARPVTMHRAEAGPVLAVVEPESVWKWKDKDPIVREDVLIRAFRQINHYRTIDIEVRLTALVEGVAIGGRPKAGYGGFSLRAAPCHQRKITLYMDPPTATPRRAWIDYSGIFTGGKGVSGVTIFEHLSNPDYPNPQHQYPHCNCVMPAYPATREVPLTKGKTLVLKHRLWVHPGGADKEQLSNVWSAYARPAKVTIEE